MKNINKIFNAIFSKYHLILTSSWDAPTTNLRWIFIPNGMTYRDHIFNMCGQAHESSWAWDPHESYFMRNLKDLYQFIDRGHILLTKWEDGWDYDEVPTMELVHDFIHGQAWIFIPSKEEIHESSQESLENFIQLSWERWDKLVDSEDLQLVYKNISPKRRRERRGRLSLK